MSPIIKSILANVANYPEKWLIVINDYYKLLKLNAGASNEDIKASYWKMAKKYHPDKIGNSHLENKFNEINEAYRILSDESKRKKYDQQLVHNSISANGGRLIFIYIVVLIVVFSFALWYLGRLSLSSF